MLIEVLAAEAGELAELIDGNELVWVLAEVFADDPQQSLGVAEAPSGNDLDVLGIYDHPIVFHRSFAVHQSAKVNLVSEL